jgi:biopolymer transport protein ExbD
MPGLIKRPRKTRRAPDVTPMIDVVFQLIIFFMVTSTFTKSHDFFDILLPKAQTVSVLLEKDTLLIQADREGRYFLPQISKTEPVEPEKLPSKILELAKDKPVLIKADLDTEYRSVIFLVELLQGLGVEEFGFAVEKREPE